MHSISIVNIIENKAKSNDSAMVIVKGNIVSQKELAYVLVSSEL